MADARLVPPHSVEAEQALLGCLLVCNDALDAVPQLRAEDFYLDAHRRIWRHVCSLVEAGETADVITVADSLAAQHETEQTGGLAYLGELANGGFSVAAIRSYCSAIQEHSRKRTLQAAVVQAHAAAYNGLDSEGALAAAESAILKARAQIEASKPAPPDVWTTCLDVRSLLSGAPPAVQWLARDRIQLGRAAIITGIGGSSKTRLLYHLAIGTILGRLPWSWQIDTTGGVVLVLTEDTAADVHRTIWGMCEALVLSAAEREQVADGLTIFALAGKSAELLAMDHEGVLRRTANYERLVERIQRLGGTALVGLDPALGLTGGDEMSQQHQRMLGKAVDDLAVQTNAAAIMTAHASKASATSDEMGSHTSRGGGAITDVVRAEFSMRTMTAKEAEDAGVTAIDERKSYVQLAATKGNHISPMAFVPIWLRRGNHGCLSEVALDFGADRETHNPRAVEQALRALAILREITVTRAGRLREWRSTCVERGVIHAGNEAQVEKTMQRLISRLLDMKAIEKGTGWGVYVPV